MLDFYEHGVGATTGRALTQHLQDSLGGEPRRSPYSDTWNGVVLALLDTLDDLEYLAAAHDPDQVDQGTERAVRDQRESMRRAFGWPTGDAAIGDLDGFLLAESRPWSELTRGPGGKSWTKLRKLYREAGLDEWRAGGYGEKAAMLRRDLGEKFLAASPDEQATMVRRRVHRYQRQGRLPPGKPSA
jgi:hypothetical protein